MKICETCGTEIATRDGENNCSKCENKTIKKKETARRRRERDTLMRSMGLIKVKGALGGTYWE